MKAHTQDQSHLADTTNDKNLINRTLSAHDRSVQEDSNASLLNMNDPLNISTIEDAPVLKPGATSYRGPVRRSLSGKTNEFKTVSQSVNVRTSHSRLQSKDMSTAPVQNLNSSPPRYIKFDPNILGKKNSMENNDIAFYMANKGSRTPLGLKETENTMKYTDPDNKDVSKPVNLKDYASYDFQEEQDVVHSLGITNKYLTNRTNRRYESHDDEEAKEVSRIERIENKVNRQEAQRLSAEVVNIVSSSADVPQRDIIVPIRNGAPEEQEDSNPPDANQENQDVRNNDNASSNQGQNENQAAQNNEAANIPQTLPQQTAMQAAIRFEVKPFLRKRITLFAALLISSVFLWLGLEEESSYRGIIVSFYVHFAHITIEGLILGYRVRGIEAWQKRENKLEALTGASCLLGLLLVDLRLSEVLSTAILAAIPLIITTTIYIFCSKAPDPTKISSGSFRFVSTLQVILIMLKIDNGVEMDWAFILIIALIFFGVILAYCIIYGFFMLLLAFLSIFRGYSGGILGRRAQFIGLVWYFVYYGLSVAGFLVIVGISQMNEPKGASDYLLRVASKLMCFMNAFLLIHTILTFKQLCKFTYIHFETGGLVGNPRNSNGGRPRATISFQVLTEKTYFINISSTYFIPLTRDFLKKNKANIEKIKGLFKDFKLKKSLSKSKENDENKKINMETLKKYKETLDEKLKNLPKDDKQEETNNSSGTALHKFLKIFSPKNTTIPKKSTNEDLSISEIRKPFSKLSLSVGNLDDLEDVYSVQKQATNQEDDDKLCYLCYANPRDCILMNCGHGGFCYDCAVSAIKTKNECMECRAKVEAIHKLDTHKNLHGVVKAIELRKVIVTPPPSLLNR